MEHAINSDLSVQATIKTQCHSVIFVHNISQEKEEAAALLASEVREVCYLKTNNHPHHSWASQTSWK